MTKNMRKLVLIRHAETQQAADVPNHEWALTEQGRQSVSTLAEALRPYQIDTLFTSTQQKAFETGKLLATELDITVEDIVEDFDEHDRSANAPYFAAEADYVAMMARFFGEPAEIIYGTESAFDARGRFANGIYDIQDESPNGTVAIVTHGTVMALFLARCMGLDAFTVWQDIQQLGTPCYAVLSLPDFALLGLFGL